MQSLSFSVCLIAEDMVFVPDEAQRKEYVLNDFGEIYQGSHDYISERSWMFGQVHTHTHDHPTITYTHIHTVYNYIQTKISARGHLTQNYIQFQHFGLLVALKQVRGSPQSFILWGS